MFQCCLKLLPNPGSQFSCNSDITGTKVELHQSVNARPVSIAPRTRKFDVERETLSMPSQKELSRFTCQRMGTSSENMDHGFGVISASGIWWRFLEKAGQDLSRKVRWTADLRPLYLYRQISRSESLESRPLFILLNASFPKLEESQLHHPNFTHIREHGGASRKTGQEDMGKVPEGSPIQEADDRRIWHTRFRWDKCSPSCRNAQH